MYCPGKKDGKKHLSNYYQCSKCNAGGCKYEGCTKYNFSGIRCMNCGHIGTPKLL